MKRRDAIGNAVGIAIAAVIFLAVIYGSWRMQRALNYRLDYGGRVDSAITSAVTEAVGKQAKRIDNLTQVVDALQASNAELRQRLALVEGEHSILTKRIRIDAND